MKTEKEIKKMIEGLVQRHSSSSNMNYEIAGAKDALHWVLNENKGLGVGRRP